MFVMKGMARVVAFITFLKPPQHSFLVFAGSFDAIFSRRSPPLVSSDLSASIRIYRDEQVLGGYKIVFRQNLVKF
ncbi:hypothetical protein A6K76_15575 [Caryophanon latum]|uniref:Uncharacterized protein n=1 Tax=Caryophanon latum TaxID=33977 RepID=A0A1C0YBC0_9BACL|nr:hypothetical protein A6K76_15575 [Caryophanon latum]